MMIDRQSPHLHAPEFGSRQPRPTTVSYGTGLTERRGRRSGQIDSKPCTRCGTGVALDSRRMQMADGQAVIGCPTCGSLVAVRRSDLHRPPLATPLPAPAGRRRGWFGRKGEGSR